MVKKVQLNGRGSIGKSRIIIKPWKNIVWKQSVKNCTQAIQQGKIFCLQMRLCFILLNKLYNIQTGYKVSNRQLI